MVTGAGAMCSLPFAAVVLAHSKSLGSFSNSRQMSVNFKSRHSKFSIEEHLLKIKHLSELPTSFRAGLPNGLTNSDHSPNYRLKVS